MESGPATEMLSVQQSIAERGRASNLDSEPLRLQRLKPRDLYVQQLRKAIHRLSSGSGNLEEATKEAVDGLLEIAREPGIDTKLSPFNTAHSLASTLKTSIARIWTRGVPLSKPLPSDTTPPHPDALYDGVVFHIWTAISSMVSISAKAEIGKYEGCIVHVVEIGTQDADGRFNSPWCRCWAHRSHINNWTFKPAQKWLWKPIFFEDGKNDALVWIKLMRAEGVQAYFFNVP